MGIAAFVDVLARFTTGTSITPRGLGAFTGRTGTHHLAAERGRGDGAKFVLGVAVPMPIEV